MLTGLEPAILDAAVGAATRAAGWGVTRARSSRRGAKLRSLVNGIETASASTDYSASPGEQAHIGEYLSSPQFNNISYSLASALICQRSERKSEEVFELIKDELRASLESVAGVAAASVYVGPIFSALVYAVSQEAAGITAHSSSLRAEAEAVKIGASIAAASSRNAELLRGTTQIAEYLDFERDLRAQVRSLHATMRIPHAGTTRQVPYDQLFISPRLEFAARTTDTGEQRGIKLEELLKHSTRSIILGDPGGGKSTLALKLAYDIASGNIADISARIPLLVVLRDYAQQARGANRISILQYLHDLSRTPYAVEPPESALEYLLLNGRALVIFDGLDELIDTALRRDIVQAVEGFAYRYPTTQIVVTSRRIGYEEAPLDPELFPALQLKDLDRGQVESYALKWFNLDEGRRPAERRQLSTNFLRDSEFVDDLRVNPLMLSLMCGIYATENYIPRNRPEVYEKCALLLFERWDKQRGIQVSLSFDAHVYAAMRSLALYMYSQEQPQLRRRELVGFIKNYLLEKRFDDADVAEGAAEEFIDFCKGRAWVLTDVGEEKYGFTHRTFLEYFSASQLVRLNPSAERLFGALEGHLSAREWDVVAQLALQILGRTVEDGADNFLDLTILAANSAEPAQKVNLLSFAARALHFIVPRPAVLRAIVSSCIQLMVDFPTPTALPSKVVGSGVNLRPSQPAIALLGVTVELRSDVGRLTQDITRDHLQESWREEQLIAYAIVPWALLDDFTESTVRVDWNFWEPWTMENWQQFEEYVIPAANYYYWIDVARLGRGEISVNDLLSKHGPHALYEYMIAGYGPYPPIAYELLLHETAKLLKRVQIRNLRGRAKDKADENKIADGNKITDQIISSLNEVLPQYPPPWLEDFGHYEVLLPALHSKTSSKLPLQLELFLSMPLVEINKNRSDLALRSSEHQDTAMTEEKLERNANPLNEVLALRLKDNVAGEEIIGLLQGIETSSEAREIIQRWILRQVDFVTSPKDR
jgi:NACHT domain